MGNSDCIFCKIAGGVIPAQRIWENERVLVFPDLHPQAPVHLLVIPKEHISSLAEAKSEQTQLLGELLAAVSEVARLRGLDGGYRVVVNTGADGGQTVSHLHLHVLGGRSMHWPPG